MKTDAKENGRNRERENSWKGERWDSGVIYRDRRKISYSVNTSVVDRSP